MERKSNVDLIIEYKAFLTYILFVLVWMYELNDIVTGANRRIDRFSLIVASLIMSVPFLSIPFILFAFLFDFSIKPFRLFLYISNNVIFFFIYERIKIPIIGVSPNPKNQ